MKVSQSLLGIPFVESTVSVIVCKLRYTKVYCILRDRVAILSWKLKCCLQSVVYYNCIVYYGKYRNLEIQIQRYLK